MEYKTVYMNPINLLIESLKDNKKLIIALYAVFIITFIVAWFLSGPQIQSFPANVTSFGSSPAEDVGALELFIHNEFGGIVTYLASVFFGIFGVLMILYNAVSLAAIGQLFSNIMPNGGIFYILYIIPHGIFEITATVIQSAAGIILFLFVWRFIKALRSDGGASSAFRKTKKILVQSIVLMVFATVLLLIAAPIEAYVSIPLSEYITGLLGLV